MLACISGCSGVIGCKVATGGVLRVKKFAQHGPIVGVSVKKFAQPTKNAPKMAFYGLPGELFRGNTDGAVALGEFCRGLSGGEGVLGELCRACRPATVPGTVPGPTLPRPHHRLPAPPPGPSTLSDDLQSLRWALYLL
ncbi:Uncharacterised protein [Mycobacteroides abscessus subsp. abscessus]|nr:Uncharacterised protein [Mycobacteroides abscessus subsp. abscessus]